jgi:hypothetical protein
MSLEMKGKLVKVLDLQSGTSKAGKQWVKQSFVIDTGSQYNSELCFNLFGQDKVDLLRDVTIGDEVTVLFNLSSREYKGNYYTSADAWKFKQSKEEKLESFDNAFGDDNPF